LPDIRSLFVYHK